MLSPRSLQCDVAVSQCVVKCVGKPYISNRDITALQPSARAVRDSLATTRLVTGNYQANSIAGSFFPSAAT